MCERKISSKLCVTVGKHKHVIVNDNNSISVLPQNKSRYEDNSSWLKEIKLASGFCLTLTSPLRCQGHMLTLLCALKWFSKKSGQE